MSEGTFTLLRLISPISNLCYGEKYVVVFFVVFFFLFFFFVMLPGDV